MTHVDVAVVRKAVSQRGLITRSQAMGVGASRGFVAHRVESGRWVQVAPGVYRLAGVPVTWRQRALAACLLAGPGAVLSHRSAAVLWGVSGFRPGPLELTVPLGCTSRNSLARIHRSGKVDATTHKGVPVTRPGRTMVDLARIVAGDCLEEAVDDVLCRRLVSLDELVRLTAELGPRRGCRALRAVLGAWSGDALPAGVAEMRVVRGLLAVGLPDPVRQHELKADGELVARVDLAYPAHRLAIELDGFRWHAGRGPFRSDRLRRNRIEKAGWRLLETAVEDVDQLCLDVAAIVTRAA